MADKKQINNITKINEKNDEEEVESSTWSARI